MIDSPQGQRGNRMGSLSPNERTCRTGKICSLQLFLYPIPFKPHNHRGQWVGSFSILTDKKTKPQEVEVTFPRSHREPEAEMGFPAGRPCIPSPCSLLCCVEWHARCMRKKIVRCTVCPGVPKKVGQYWRKTAQENGQVSWDEIQQRCEVRLKLSVLFRSQGRANEVSEQGCSVGFGVLT